MKPPALTAAIASLEAALLAAGRRVGIRVETRNSEGEQAMSTYEWDAVTIDVPGGGHQVSTDVVFSVGPDGSMRPSQPEHLSRFQELYLALFEAALGEAESVDAIDAVWRVFSPTFPELANLMKHLCQLAAMKLDKAARRLN